MFKKHYQNILNSVSEKKQMLAILIDPDKFNVFETDSFLKTIPKETTHIFVGGSTVKEGITKKVIETLKNDCTLPIIIFPGDFTQISNDADGILFLSLLSGRNPEYLIGQQIKSVPVLKKLTLEIIPTGYILIDGENESAVARVTNTSAISQQSIDTIIDTAIAGEYLGMKLIYLEAGSGAKTPANERVIKAVSEAISIPLIVGGGIKTEDQKRNAYASGANMIVMGTAFEK
jgi:phosphoglycerol geranylgeranyltransferase